MKSGKDLLNGLAKLSAAYESVNDTSNDSIIVKDAYEHASENWTVILNNIRVVKNQLLQIPNQWRDFIKKYVFDACLYSVY